jgi:hypothetical protein
MNLVKSLALGSAAAFVALSGAQAADLPGAEPVEYVKVCDAYGAGFFYIPGSDTCLQIGGFARLQVSAGEVTERRDTDVKGNNNVGYRVRARLWFDSRTETEYGTVRAYVRAQFQRTSGGVNGRMATDAGEGQDDAIFDKAFVQFAGLTAGLTDSYWDFKPYPTFQNPFVSDRTLPVLAYTFDFGGGFSASVSLEDNTGRRSTASGGLAVSNVGTQFNTANYQEQKYPDLVGNVRVQQGWGEAQISGFGHYVNVDGNTGPVVGGGTAAGRDSEWGYGASIGAKVNLPFLAKGDYVWGSAAYAKGALSYLALGNSGDFNFGISNTQSIANGNRTVDFEVNDGKLRLTEGYGLNLGVLHYWDPKWRSAFQGSYVDVNVKRAGEDFAAYSLTTNLIWTPVKKLDIGAEVVYGKVTNKSDSYAFKKSSEIITRLHVQRDF